MIRKHSEFNTLQLPPALLKELQDGDWLLEYRVPGFFVKAVHFGWILRRDVSAEDKTVYPELTALLQANTDVMFAWFDSDTDDSDLLPWFPIPTSADSKE